MFLKPLPLLAINSFYVPKGIAGNAAIKWKCPAGGAECGSLNHLILGRGRAAVLWIIKELPLPLLGFHFTPKV